MRHSPTAISAHRGAHAKLLLFPGCDPLRLLDAALHRAGQIEFQAEDLILAWLLSLAPASDPAHAARAALAVYGRHNREHEPVISARVRALLGEVSRYPDVTLTARVAGVAGSRGQRRGGPTGRLRHSRSSSRREG